MDQTDPLTNYQAIRNELEQYDEQLGQRPEIVAVTKADFPDAAAVREQLAAAIDRPVLLISAVTGEGLNELVAAIVKKLDKGTAGERGWARTKPDKQ